MTNPYADHFRVIVAGSRDFDDYGYLCDRLDALLGKKERVLMLCGMARGADTLGETWAIERGHIVQYYPADWAKEGKSAGYKRNVVMAENADALVAFWDGRSRGAKHMIDIANRMGLQVRVDEGWK